MELLYLPITSFASWFAFRKWGYNFLEHLIINAFAGGMRLATLILLFPILTLTLGSPISAIIAVIGLLVTLMLTFWLFVQFFSFKPLEYVLSRLLLHTVVIIDLTVGISIIEMSIYMNFFTPYS